jgi:hypothetical protein
VLAGRTSYHEDLHNLLQLTRFYQISLEEVQNIVLSILISRVLAKQNREE